MNSSVVEKIGNAVLYEGYVLYPYRPSAVKNRQRFNFGVLYPLAYCELNPGSDSSIMQTECLVAACSATAVEVKVRFLQMAARDGWQEGIERDVSIPQCRLESILLYPIRKSFLLDATTDAEGRRLERLEGELELTSTRIEKDLLKLTLRVRNTSDLQDPHNPTRDEALLQALVSVHSILQVEGGNFISSMDPPDRYRAAAAECQNVGTWPVLAGEEGQSDLMLSSPIILYDYPAIAPESAGDLCDGTEIDEILALRILTMTEDEKREIRQGDDRARRILESTESLPAEQFQKLHGALRSMPAPSKDVR